MPNPKPKHPPVKLTKGYVDRVKSGDRDEIHWDTDAKGFGLKVSPVGNRVFIVQGRVSGLGNAARITVGPYGVFTVDQARDVAREHLRSMRLGIDPRDTRRQDEAMGITLRQVADAYFARGLLKENTRRDMDRHIETAFAKWKNRPIASITPAECRQLFEKITNEGLRGKPAPSAATLYMTTLRTLINFAIDEYRQLDGTPVIMHNPVSILKRDMKPSPPRTRHIDRRQIGEFWNWLTTARTLAANADMLAGLDLVMFLLLTGARRNEGAALTWDRVNIDDSDPSNCWFHLPDPKNKNPVWLPLSSQAVAVLKARQEAKDRAANESAFVFSSRSKTGHIMDTRAPLERFAKLIGMERLSAHDLRRTFVTLGVKACRLDIAKLEMLTNHVPQGITARHYLETSDLRDYHHEVQAIGDYVEQQAQIAAGDNVVALADRA